MNIHINVALLGLICALSGCATTGNQSALTPTHKSYFISNGEHVDLPAIDTGPRPEWLIRASIEYPRRDFYPITAHATSPEAAAQKAYEAAIDFMRPEPEAAELGELRHAIKIVKLWHDQQRFHALAVIPRRDGEQHLRNQVDALDNATRATVAALYSTDDPLIKVGLLQTAITRQQLRAAYQKSFKKIDRRNEGRESPWDTRRWSMQMSALLGELLITPTIVTDPHTMDTLAPTLKQGLLNAGMHVARPFEADYLLLGTLNIEERELDSGYVQASGNLQLELQHVKTQKHYGIQTWALEVTSMNAEDAKSRLVNKAGRLLTEDKRKTIVGIAKQQAPGAEQTLGRADR